jgi:adenosylmethionine-8-amino-7-oxononanoate aminotransferase
MDDAVVFFTSGGAESVETAAKLARRYWSLVGEPERTVVISRERAYHGMAAYGTSIVGMEPFRAGLGTLVSDTVRVPWDSAQALADAIEAAGPGRVAAFFCEPIIGAGGVLIPPEGYLQEVRRICRDTGVLFVADEVICGYGRVGDWFASRRFGLDPDLVTFAKGITSGYVPLGGVIVGTRVSEPFWKRPETGIWRHGYTYSGHATATAAAHPNLDIIEREGLLARALELETELADALAPLASHPLVGEIRAGLGVVAAVQLDADAVAADPTLPDRAGMAAREAGVMIRPLAGGALAMSPALVITQSELDELAAMLQATLDAVAVSQPAVAAAG